MAIVKGVLTEAQILGFRGTIDFYYHRGQLIARQWPKKRTIPPTAQESSNREFFGRVQSKIKNMPEDYRQQWRMWLQGPNIVWTDAIRFFTLPNNPEKHVWPTVRWAHSIAYFDGVDWFFSHYFLPLEADLDRISELWGVWNNLGDQEPITPWHVVGRKRRRRAIMDNVYRPALKNVTNAGVLQFDDTGRYWVKDAIPDPQQNEIVGGNLIVGLVPNQKRDWLYSQTPHVGFKFPVLAPGEKKLVYPVNQNFPSTPVDLIPPGHWTHWY